MAERAGLIGLNRCVTTTNDRGVTRADARGRIVADDDLRQRFKALTCIKQELVEKLPLIWTGLRRARTLIAFARFRFRHRNLSKCLLDLLHRHHVFFGEWIDFGAAKAGYVAITSKIAAHIASEQIGRASCRERVQA